VSTWAARSAAFLSVELGDAVPLVPPRDQIGLWGAMEQWMHLRRIVRASGHRAATIYPIFDSLKD
jgi:hypothetical protein